MAKSRKVVFDAGFLILLLQEGAPAPVDPDTKESIPRPKDRIEYLVERLAAEESRILIPTPAFSEFLVHAGDALESYVDAVAGENLFSVEPFSMRAAIEAAEAVRAAKEHRKTQDDGEKAAWQRVKVDIQIAAVAKVEGAAEIYTTDRGLVQQASLMKLGAIHLAELPLPPTPPQKALFEGTEDGNSDEGERNGGSRGT